MARDYKKRTPTRKRKKKSAASPVQFMSAGFALGIIVAVLVYRFLAPPVQPGGPVPTAPHEPPSAVQPPDTSGQRAAKRRNTEDDRFTFYDLLPNFEVVIPETKESVAGVPAPRPVDIPGAYILQAGSFRSFSDADRMKAILALQGIESQIQKVSIDDQTWHRVRVGPMTDLSQVNDLRTRMRMADIDALLLRVAQ